MANKGVYKMAMGMAARMGNYELGKTGAGGAKRKKRGKKSNEEKTRRRKERRRKGKR